MAFQLVLCSQFKLGFQQNYFPITIDLSPWSCWVLCAQDVVHHSISPKIYSSVDHILIFHCGSNLALEHSGSECSWWQLLFLSWLYGMHGKTFSVTTLKLIFQVSKREPFSIRTWSLYSWVRLHGHSTQSNLNCTWSLSKCHSAHNRVEWRFAISLGEHSACSSMQCTSHDLYSKLAYIY